MLDVCLPGTGGMMPLPERFLTCCFLEYQGGAVLIDCGEGTQVALRKSGCKMSRLEVMLITHLHADHVAGIPGLLLTAGNQGKESPLLIVGPKGIQQVLHSLLIIAPPLPFEIQVMEIDAAALEAGRSAELFSAWDGLEISCLPLQHSMPCLGYRAVIRRKPVFDPKKAESLGVPISMYRRLHGGDPAELEDGRTILPEQVIAGQREPIRFCYMTDTRPVPGMREFADQADLLISEGMYGTDEMAEQAQEKMHLLFSESAQIAKAAGAKRLWLTHYSPSLRDPLEFEPAAKAIFSEARAAYDGMRISL